MAVSAASRPLTPRQVRARLPADLRGLVSRARQLRSRPLATLPTRVRALDRLLAGGLPRGRLVELVGRRSSGRFSTLLSTLAAVTGDGEPAALVDLGSCLSPQQAAAAGMVLERLLWIRPGDSRQALFAAEAALGAGFPLVVLDLGAPPVPGGRGPEASWLRLARTAAARRAGLLVSSPYRVSGIAAEVVVESRRGRSDWRGQGAAPRLLAGLNYRFELVKDRLRASGAEVVTFRTAPRGVGDVSTAPGTGRRAERTA